MAAEHSLHIHRNRTLPPRSEVAALLSGGRGTLVCIYLLVLILSVIHSLS
jgi:hypothetical protein